MKTSYLLHSILTLLPWVFQSNTNEAGHLVEKYGSTEIAFSKADTVYRSENLILLQLSAHTYQHISYLTTNDFGKVACNGMVVVNESQAVVFDTPTDKASSEELVNYVSKDLKSTIIAIVPTHFHEDCVGGMEIFQQFQVPAFASNKTIELLQKNGNPYVPLLKGFEDSLTIALGNQKVMVEFLGEGHTKDNVIGYFPADSALFGGCLIKESGASKGYLGDANVEAWSTTALAIKRKYPQTKTVVPGHGKSGGSELLDYTATLFRK